MRWIRRVSREIFSLNANTTRKRFCVILFIRRYFLDTFFSIIIANNMFLNYSFYRNSGLTRGVFSGRITPNFLRSSSKRMVIEWFPTREREREREKKKRIERLSHTSGQVEYEQHVRYQLVPEDLLSALIFLWKPFFFRHILHKKLKLQDFLYVSCRRRYIFNALLHSFGSRRL